ncbi:MAG: GxxExxY protein [Desulfobacterales bacterium]|nr:GxxExxY protein [Desulfobacterales bacterium]
MGDIVIKENEHITHKIIGCAMNVHNKLGNGFQEVIYQRCLSIEFKKIGLIFERERKQLIYYDGIEVGTRRVDFLVENKILVELKAIIKLENVHLAQAINYLEAFNLPIGLLINFGATKLEFKRLIKKSCLSVSSF